VTKTALVIGGGTAGIAAALNIAEHGFEAHLVEKSGDLGGHARDLYWNAEGDDVRGLVDELIERVESHPRVCVHRHATVSEVSGFVGNFVTTVEFAETNERAEIEHGVAIIATGAEEHRPTEYLCGGHPRSLTVTELERLMTGGSKDVPGAETVVFIQRVGSREPDRP